MNSPSVLQAALKAILAGRNLTEEEAFQVFLEMVSGQASEALMAAVLVALRMKGETTDELVGGARALRQTMIPVAAPEAPVLDTCGTGGDGLRTFNISTAVAIVVAACGVTVAKHGNRAVSGCSGSVDVLAELGVRVELEPAEVTRCLRQTGLGFCFAPRFHSSMRHAQPVRRQLGIRTIFNYLGPLVNPARPSFQLVGVGERAVQVKLAEALARLGVQRAWVVHGEDGLDEITLGGRTHVFVVENGCVRSTSLTPSDFGLPQHSVSALAVESAAESAALIREVLHGKQGPARDFVLANAAAALVIAGCCEDLRQGVHRAACSIDEGQALALLEQLRRVSWQQPSPDGVPS
jgi:anthranilate phosphoribosyltransferase